LTDSATISFPDSVIKIFIEQEGINAEDSTAVGAKDDVL
jgi:hypothetical protein